MIAAREGQSGFCHACVPKNSQSSVYVVDRSARHDLSRCLQSYDRANALGALTESEVSHKERLQKTLTLINL